MGLFDLINANPITCIIITVVIGLTIAVVTQIVCDSIDKYLKRRYPNAPEIKNDLPGVPDLNIH